MKHFLILALLLSTGCQTERINRQLRLSKKHLARAIELGAHMDSVKTDIKATGNIGAVQNSDSTTAKVNPDKTVDACADLLSNLAGITTNQKRVIDSLLTIPKPKPSAKPFKDLQAAVCPNDSVHNKGTIDIVVGKQTIKIPYTLDAWSIKGKAGYYFELPKTEFEYIKETVQINATPVNEPTVFGKILRGAGLLLIGIVIGFILGKVFKFGVNL